VNATARAGVTSVAPRCLGEWSDPVAVSIVRALFVAEHLLASASNQAALEQADDERESARGDHVGTERRRSARLTNPTNSALQGDIHYLD